MLQLLHLILLIKNCFNQKSFIMRLIIIMKIFFKVNFNFYEFKELKHLST